MTISIITGILLIVIPVAFNVLFFLLQKRFEYPDILRKPTDYILQRFRAGGSRLVALWYAFMFTAILFLPVAILAPQVLAPSDAVFVALATTCGVLSGFSQVLGLIRWPFVVPHLAQAYADPNASQATRDALAVVFQAFHRYAGVAIGEHLGYFFTSLWTVLMATALIQSAQFPAWLGWVGLIPAIGIFVGLLEEAGFKAAAAVNAISYILWSIWLIALGIVFLTA
jgi:hypothetical protein